MYRKTSDFITDWKYESEATLKLFKLLNDQSLEAKLHDKVRSIGNLAWHIAKSPVEMFSHAGLDMAKSGVDLNATAPSSVNELIKKYEAASAEVFAQVTKWSDEELSDKVSMYGEMWKKGTVLSVLINHQTHHRGQLTILMRMQNLPVTGVYGPSYEEWSAMGLEPEK
jgi:uncharacterized damage-inducible protein DinB